MTQKRYDVSVERLRIAERCLIGASADRPELLTDDNWIRAMQSIYKLLKERKRRK